MTVEVAAPPVAEGLFRIDPPALLASRCRVCGGLRFPATSMCAACGGRDVVVDALSTTGTIFTFSVVRASPPGYLGDVPYAVGVVELPDGLRVTSTIVTDDLGSLAIGDTVSFELVTLTNGESPLTSFAFRRLEGR